MKIMRIAIVTQDEEQFETGREKECKHKCPKDEGLYKTAEHLSQSERRVVRVVCDVRNTEIAHTRKFGFMTRSDTD